MNRKRDASMATMPTPNPAVETIEVKRRGFDLDKFERVSLTGKVSFTALPKENFIEAALTAVNGDSDKLYNLMNSAIRRATVMEAKNGIQPPETMPNWVPSAKVVMSFVNNFRVMKPYKDIQDRGQQTAAIFAELKKQPALIESLKTLALASAAAGEDEDEGDEE